MGIREKDFSGDTVTYSGSLYCVIRSPKHSGSSAYHDLQVMKCVQSIDTFNDSFNNNTGKSKLVLVVNADGVRMKIRDTQKLSNVQSIISPRRTLMCFFYQ